MYTLYHAPLCPASRFTRLILAEYGLNPKEIEENVHKRRPDFLQLNPAGNVPTLVEKKEDESKEPIVLPGPWVIAEYIDETLGKDMGSKRLMPQEALERAEVRRLMEWFFDKFSKEVSHWILHEKVEKYQLISEGNGGPPDMNAIRIAKHNIRTHLHYIGWLASRRNWLAGDTLSYADFAAAAHLSCLDYLADVPWDANKNAKEWYARIKSRPSFRNLLTDRILGHTPPTYYTDLDF